MPCKPPSTANPKQRRIDAASLEDCSDPKRVRLVFHEAKHYGSSDLKKENPEVACQMREYHETIVKYAAALAGSYPHVCSALVRIDAMQRKVRDSRPEWTGKTHRGLDKLVDEVANGERTLQVDAIPRLIVFGFDADQKAGGWKAQAAQLRKHGLEVRSIGDPTGQTTSVFRPKKTNTSSSPTKPGNT